MRLRIGTVAWAFVYLLPVLTAALKPTYFISAPNVIRVDVNETIVINIFGDIDAGDEGVPVTVLLQDYPARTKEFDSQTVNVRKNDPTSLTLRVNSRDVVPNDNPHLPQYVYLQASSESAALSQFNKETPILLSYKAGYAFLQTDKPIYTPNQKVFIRLVALDQQMRPSQKKVIIDVITPQNIVVKRFNISRPDDGFVSGSFQFPPAPMFGNWSVVAFYGHEMRHNTTVQFLVKEYVLPTFSVNVEIQPQSYILSSHLEVTVLVNGDYVFGEKVQGYYRIKYHLLDTDGSMQLIKDGIAGTLNEHSQGEDTLYLRDVIGDSQFDEFIGKRLHIEAFIIEGATGKVQSTNTSVLQFVGSPFVIKWDQTLKYFKTNLPFVVKADVLYTYGDPVPRLDVRVSAVTDTGHELQSEEDLKQTNSEGHVFFTLNVPQEARRIIVTMTTVARGNLANFEKTDEFQVEAFNSQGYNELLIRPAAQGFVSVDDSIAVDLLRNGRNAEDVDVMFSYIVAGGKIIQAKAIEEVIANTVSDILITQDMVPSARMLAFYVNDNNKVVADSVWIDVEDQCENPVKITVPDNKNGKRYYMPRDEVILTLEAKQRTKIALLAVDSAVYLLQDYHRLDKKKIFSKMAAYDLGCGPGGGRDTEDIFKNAGITILTNAELQTQARNDRSCDEHNRRRRSVAEPGFTLTELEEMYEGNDTLIRYCNNGKKIVENWPCLRRARALMGREELDWEDPIVQALYKCCLAFSQASGRSGGGRGQQPAIEADLGGILMRTMFPESWLFEFDLVDMGDEESMQHEILLPGSITTWVIHAVGVSPLHGMCVADNKEIIVRQEYFLDLSLPYSVMRNEQVAIVATVYNYDEDGNDIEVLVKMEGVDGLCSNVKAGEFEEKMGEIKAKSAKSFTFVVIPFEAHDYQITIYMFSNFGNDAIRKTLHVVPEGISQVKALSVTLDPTGARSQEDNQIVEGHSNILHRQFHDDPNQHQIDRVSMRVPNDSVPDTEKCEISLIGSLLGPIASAIIEGLNGGSFLNKPSGCGEQTMILTAPNVYIFKYLKSIDKVTSVIEEAAINNIEDGISREVQHYRNEDGSFKTFADTPGNSWLTAFVLRVICQAKEFVVVDDNIICKGMEYLSNLQNASGSFNFTHKTWHGSTFMGGVDEPIPLTAFVLIALKECSCHNLDPRETVKQATRFLENKLPEIAQDAHTMAIVTYALALVNITSANRANTQLQELAHYNAGTRYFGLQSSGPLTVETTAYALLAQIKLEEYAYSYPIVLWLMGQRDQVGQWYSTQDTMVALQALSTYAQRTGSGNIDMRCDATSTNGNFVQNWEILPETALILQATQAQVPVGGELVFETRGHGIATLSVKLRYNKASGTDNLCPFEVTVTPKELEADPVLPGAPEGDNPKPKISIQVCAKYLGEGKTNMAIFDVGLLSGFRPITENLKKVTAETNLIQAFEVSDRSVIFYADEIPAGDGVEPLCVEFEAEQTIKIGSLQPVPVKVYDYYLPEKECIKFYRPDGRSALLQTICEGTACECVAARCLNQNPDLKLNAIMLKGEACKTVNHFAYKATFVEKQDKDTFEVFTMRISPLKTGLDQLVNIGQTRTFWKSANCEEPVLEEGNDYLIVGKGGLPIRDENDIIGYRHFIGNEFTIIHWPTAEQFRAKESACKQACPEDHLFKKCKVGCRQKYRPEESAHQEYFQLIEAEFMLGCQD